MSTAYATTSELAAMGGLPSAVLARFTDDEQVSAIEQASGIANGYLRSQYDPPFVVVPDDLKLHVCRISAYFLMRRIGFDPEKGSDVVIREDYRDAIAWLKDVAKGVVSLFDEVDASPEIDEGEPVVVSLPLRGI